MFYTSNLLYGFNDLQTKLTFFIIPLVFFGLNISSNSFEKIKITFIISSVVSLGVLFFISAKKYYYSSDLSEFLYFRLAHNSHSSYLTIYFNLAMLFILENIFSKKKYFSITLAFFLFFFLYIGILLLSARTATIVTIISVSIYPLLLFGKNILKNGNWLMHVLFLFVITAMFYFYLHYNNRFNQVEQEIVLRVNSINADSLKFEEPNSTNIRLNIWKYSIELIKKSPVIGIGTGDLKEELVNIYKKNNYQYGVQKRISPHNQFLHTGVILGIVGILFLVAYFFLPMICAFKKNDWLYLIFLFIILINGITESILEREAGILFFTAFNTIFYFNLISEKIESQA